MKSNSVTLYDCFAHYRSKKYSIGENHIYCNVCKSQSDFSMTQNIYFESKIFIIILNRGKNNIHNIQVDFDEYIDLAQFVLSSKQRKIKQMIYELYGVITILGPNGPNAHFVASCKNPINKRWYQYNDDLVKPLNNIRNEVINFGTPYILFYKKLD